LQRDSEASGGADEGGTLAVAGEDRLAVVVILVVLCVLLSHPKCDFWLKNITTNNFYDTNVTELIELI
jgi:hypothetical protein